MQLALDTKLSGKNINKITAIQFTRSMQNSQYLCGWHKTVWSITRGEMH